MVGGAGAGAGATGACVAGACDFVAGAAGAAGAALLSKIVEDVRFPEKYPSVSEVIIKTIAMPVVNRVRKFPAPLLPKMVELEPPKTAPTSAPLPVCSKTTRIKPMLTIT